MGDNDGGNEGEGGKRRRECTGGLDLKGVWWLGGVAYPAFSVDVAALCGPPHTDTPANESDLVSRRTPSLHLCARQNKAHLH